MPSLEHLTERCSACRGALPVGVKVAFFVDQESDDAYLGDFCCVAHAFAALDEIAGREEVPETLYLGVRVDRDEHDEGALATVMADLARRAVRAAMAEEEALLGEEEELPSFMSPSHRTSMLN